MSALPKMDLKKVQEVWDWIEFKAGVDGEPAWNQEHWATVITTDEEAQNSLRSAARDEVVRVHGVNLFEEEYCGTACCVAGYVLKDKTDFTYVKESGFPSPILLVGEKVFNVEDEYMIIEDERDWEYYAAFALGITLEEANKLFGGCNTAEEIKALFNEFLEKRGEAMRL